ALLLHQKKMIEMQEYAFIIGVVVKVMHLIRGYEKNCIVKNIVCFEINRMFSHSFLKPYHLIKAVNVWLCYLAMVFLYMSFQIIQGKLRLVRLIPVQVIFINYVCFFFSHYVCQKFLPFWFLPKWREIQTKSFDLYDT